MKDLKYQQRAVTELVEKTVQLLSIGTPRQQLVFKAPTGSGKTVMAAQMLGDLTQELASRSDCPVSEVAFIWFAPNKLHQQSYSKLKNFFGETRVLRTVMFDELDHADGVIHPGEILFVNWESINKKNNVIVRDSEQNNSLYEITRRTQQEQGTPIVAIIDEEHLFWSRTADKTAEVLRKIMPRVEIRISATPKTTSDYTVTIPREDVIREQMIKERVILNPDIDEGYSDEWELTQNLMECALRKRRQLAEAYKKEGTNINPLLLIQLPNDQKETLSSEEQVLVDQIKTYLNAIKDINEENGKLAVWLSGEKSNLTGLEKPDSLTEVLLFKQAIALGWDCPRAAVLLIFRKHQGNEFTVQTVGRILRMPEQRYYPTEALNVGYVYTDISKDVINIVSEDMSYLCKDAYLAVRREGLRNVALTSIYSQRLSSDRNRLNPDFRKVLAGVFKERWAVQQPLLFSLAELDGEETEPTPTSINLQSKAFQNREKVKHIIRFDVKNVNIEIPKDMVFQNEVTTLYVNEEGKAQFARSVGELQRIYKDFCDKLLGGNFERKHSTGILAGYLLTYLEEHFDLLETDAIKVILYHENRPKFEEIVTVALQRYLRIIEKRKDERKARSYVDYTWEVPAERYYKVETHHPAKCVHNHALLPFVELNAASSPEREFAAFLEQNTAYIDWWYKNGDEGKQHYAVPYQQADGTKSLFYVDFVVRMKNGQVFLFDTKSKDSDPEAPNKHNALVDYLQANKEQNLKGGVLIAEGSNWMFSQFKIENTHDLMGWTAFHPDLYKS
ncbi:MAG: DEAD/DEAH box helicase family protein [Alloprevotella sp.]